MTDSGRQWEKWVVCLLLGALVVVVFWPAVHCNFVDFDDKDYVLSNTNIQHGLNWASIQWAFTTAHSSNWHPLTWLSHILDCQLYGLAPAGHHFTSLLLHLANALLLFLLLNRLTGALWPSAFVAAMFALHPLRVESVVWISERKDVLSSLFWILTLGAYVRYVEEFKAGRSLKFKGFYTLALALFACALMAKPMAVTLPFVLLLLDYWPLGRLEFGHRFSWRLILEKIPFLLLAAGDSVVTFLIQMHHGVVTTLERFPMSVRLANVPIAYIKYIRMNFWPFGLAVFYPHQPLGPWTVGAAVVLLGGVTILALRYWHTHPQLLVGWFWFLGMLVPTIGFVQVGYQAMADRYTYLPSIGLWIMLTWAVRDSISHRPIPRMAVAVGGSLAVLACVFITPAQIFYWQNTRTLFTHSMAATDQRYTAYFNLACEALGQKEYSQAIDYFKTALAYEKDSALWTDHSKAYNNMGYAYLKLGDITNAVVNFEKAVTVKPKYPEAFFNMGRAFLANNQPDVAVEAFQSALSLEPNVAETHFKLANALAQLNRHAEAIAHYSQALQLAPGMDEAANNLAWLLATCPNKLLRDGPKAVALARQASEHSHDQNPVILGTLAAAYAQEGNLSAAVSTAQRGQQLALAQNNRALAGVLESQCRQYQNDRGGHSP